MKKLFTLIELIVVIVVLGILSAIVVPNIKDIKEQATIAALDSDARNIETAVDMYVHEKEIYPTKDGKSLETKESTEEFIEEIILDGEIISTKEILTKELVRDGFLRKESKNKKATFYLVEGGDVVWVYEGINTSVEPEEEVLVDKNKDIVEPAPVEQEPNAGE